MKKLVEKNEDNLKMLLKEMEKTEQKEQNLCDEFRNLEMNVYEVEKELGDSEPSGAIRRALFILGEMWYDTTGTGRTDSETAIPTDAKEMRPCSYSLMSFSAGNSAEPMSQPVRNSTPSASMRR